MTLLWRRGTTTDPDGSPARVGELSRRDRARWWAAGFGAIVAVVLFGLAHRALADDAYITMSYARNIAEHLHWGLLTDRGSNTQTSPLNAWLLAGVIGVTGRPVVAVGAVLVATFTLIGWWGSGLAAELGLRSRLMLPTLLITLLATSPLLVSTIGLETYLGVAVLVGLARCAVAGRTARTGLLCGLAILVRPDMAVPAGVLSLLLVLPPDQGRAWARLGRVIAIATVVALPWHLLSWRLLGGFVPDTTWMKTQYPDAPTMVDAPLRIFWPFFGLSTLIAAVPVAAALVCCVVAVLRRGERWARVALVSAGAGWAHWAGLALIGAFPQAWYFAPLVACSMLTVALTLSRMTALSAWLPVAVLAAAALVTTGPAPWAVMPMAVNFARTDQYAEIGADLGALTGGQPVLGPGEIGVLAFHSAVPVIDNFGDRWMTRAWTDRRYARGGDLGKLIMRVNWHYRAAAPRPAPRFGLFYLSLVPSPPGSVLRSWPVDMPWRGSDTVVLTRIG